MTLEKKFDILYLGDKITFTKIEKPLALLAENLKEKINFDFGIDELNYLTMDVIRSLKEKDYDLYVIGDLHGREEETIKFIREEKEKPNIFSYFPGQEVPLSIYCKRLMRTKLGFKPKEPLFKT